MGNIKIIKALFFIYIIAWVFICIALKLGGQALYYLTLIPDIILLGLVIYYEEVKQQK